jgi:hypothetical protein
VCGGSNHSRCVRRGARGVKGADQAMRKILKERASCTRRVFSIILAGELELEVIQFHMAQKPVLWERLYARALHASPTLRELKCQRARDAPSGWAGRGRVRVRKALVCGCVISEVACIVEATEIR